MTNRVTSSRLRVGTGGNPPERVRLPVVKREDAAAWFRKLRTEAGLTQWEVAEKLSTDERTIMRMENPGKGWPEGGTLLAYLELMGVLREVPEPRAESQLDEDDLLGQATRLLLEVQRRRARGH